MLRLRPAAEGSTNYWRTDNATTLKHLEVSAGILVHYDREPLVVRGLFKRL